ncbi:hypothetical protein BJY52DRAFT_570226 [Lactarius psammicola]|nr:hypothetical protein BJY52DRAFT_570226 [Lactarius psammicola]
MLGVHDFQFYQTRKINDLPRTTTDRFCSLVSFTIKVQWPESSRLLVLLPSSLSFSSSPATSAGVEPANSTAKLMRLQPQPQPLSRLISMTMIITLPRAGMDITRKLVMAHSPSRPFHTIKPQTYMGHTSRMQVQVQALPALVLVDAAYAMEDSKIHTVLSLIHLSSMRCTRQGRTWQQGNPRGGAGVTNYDLLQAAGLSSSDPYAVTRGPSTRSGLSHGPSQSGTSGLTRSQSQGTSTLPTTMEGYPMPMPAPAPGYQGGQDGAYTPDEKARYSASYAPGGVVSTMPPDEDEDAYDGYQEQPSGTLENPHSPGFAGPRAGEGAYEQSGRAPYAQEEAARASFADDEDYGYSSGQRVLRVANE